MSAEGNRSVLSAEELLVWSRAVRLNSWIAAGICAFVAGFAVWLATAVLLWKGGVDVGKNLAILGTYLPGYEVSWGGAWIGFLWGAVLGSIAGWIMYASYANPLRRRIERQLVSTAGVKSLRVPTFVISGGALGTGLGLLVAGLLLIMTNWLVLRGTADQSYHAALLGQVLPGYEVSFVGSLIGAVEVFLAVFLWSLMFALIYNKLARRRREIDR